MTDLRYNFVCPQTISSPQTETPESTPLTSR